ncbi:MAG TPA: calcium-binding protein [Dehalococcoidia bacterium]|nr:calcium-binding protein [Dehalococcoidia bacterium]
MTIFNQDFRTPGSEVITNFDPGQDVIDFTSVNAGRPPEDFQQGAGERARAFNDGLIVNRQGDGVSLVETDGGTLISAGEGNSLFVENVTPDQLSVSNITVDGQAIDISPDSDLQSILDVIAPTGGVNAEGGDGDDNLAGSVGNDTLDGGAGDDVLGSGRGADTLDGGAGDDVLRGGMGDDVLYGGEGNDVLSGDQQDDFLDGGAGDDVLQGGAGSDTLYGGEGDDVLDGGAQRDILKGGAGDDTLEGGAGDDILKGGKGDDTFVQDFSKPGSDTITDFNPGQDTINFTGLDNLDNVSVEETFGGTVINAGPGNSLFVQGVALDQFSVDNITIDGQAVSSGLGDFDLGSVLGDASSGSSGPDALDFALGKSLDASASQGGAVAESQTAVDALEQAGAVSEAAAAEEAAAEEAVDEAAAG